MRALAALTTSAPPRERTSWSAQRDPLRGAEHASQIAWADAGARE